MFNSKKIFVKIITHANQGSKLLLNPNLNR